MRIRNGWFYRKIGEKMQTNFDLFYQIHRLTRMCCKRRILTNRHRTISRQHRHAASEFIFVPAESNMVILPISRADTFELTSLTLHKVQRAFGSSTVRRIYVERCSRGSLFSFATLILQFGPFDIHAHFTAPRAQGRHLTWLWRSTDLNLSRSRSYPRRKQGAERPEYQPPCAGLWDQSSATEGLVGGPDSQTL